MQSNNQNEYTFIIEYFSKVLSIIFDMEGGLFGFKWGESKLAASKEEENLAKNDDEKRSVGSSIDCVFLDLKLNLDLVLVEVSGPMHKEDYSHFLKDRLKIARNLKSILKSIYRKSFIASEARHVNVFGLHVYRNTIRLYSMSMPILNMYCFVELMKVAIPTTPTAYAKELPPYIKKLAQMFNIVKNGHDVAEAYLNNYYDYTSDESHSNDEGHLSPPYLSPRKRTTQSKPPTAKRNKTVPSSSTNKKGKQRA